MNLYSLILFIHSSINSFFSNLPAFVKD